MTTDNLIIGKRYSVSSNNDCVITDTATGYTLASISAGTQAVIVPISDSITSDKDCVILPVDKATVMPGIGQGGNGEEGNNIMILSTNGEMLTYNLTDAFTRVPSYSVPEGVKRITGSIGAATNCQEAFHDAPTLEICDIDLSAATTLYKTFMGCKSLYQVDSEFTAGTNLYCAFYNTGLTEWTKDFPNATNMQQAFNKAKLTRWKSHCPKATDILLIFYDCPLYDFDIDFPSISTFDFTRSGYNNLGLPQYLTNVTAPEGGLASCTSFILGNKHTALTDASIKNIVDALPDWTGTETTALAQFPAGRLTEAQQVSLTVKGWTWSEATD